MVNWALVFTKQAQKDARKLRASGLKPRAERLLEILALNPYQNHHPASHTNGSILIVVLWTLFFLAALAVALATYVGGVLNVVRRIEQRTAAYYLARAGVESAAATAIECGTNAWHSLGQSWENNPGSFREVPVGNAGTFSVVHPGATIDPHETNLVYGLADESARINLNALPLDSMGCRILQTLLQSVGGLDATRAAETAAAIIDWRDVSNTVFNAGQGVTGAESDYYRGLTPPYACHDGPLDSLEELLLVRGVDATLLERIRGYLTVYGSNTIANINTADTTVLTALAHAPQTATPAVSAALADTIVRMRSQSGGFTNRNGVTAIVMAKLQAPESTLLLQILSLFGFRAEAFRGVACGQLSGSKTPDRTIEFVVNSRGEFLYWHEN